MGTTQAASPGPAILQSPHLGSQLCFALNSRVGGLTGETGAAGCTASAGDALCCALFFFLPM